MSGPTDRTAAERMYRDVRAALQGRREHIAEQIRTYPAPIPACDLQFNTLLEERDRLAEELEQLDVLCGQGAAEGASLSAVEAFVRASAFIDEEAARRLRAGLDA